MQGEEGTGTERMRNGDGKRPKRRRGRLWGLWYVFLNIFHCFILLTVFLDELRGLTTHVHHSYECRPWESPAPPGNHYRLRYTHLSLAANASRRGSCLFSYNYTPLLPRCKREPERFWFFSTQLHTPPPPSLQTRAGWVFFFFLLQLRTPPLPHCKREPEGFLFLFFYLTTCTYLTQHVLL